MFRIQPDLHIITFAVPFPPVYGGAMDCWHRLRALKDEGVSIHLHCFLYKAFVPRRELHEVADEVHYYPRMIWPALLSQDQPYIVASRRNKMLLARLKKDTRPVWFDGLHTTGFVPGLSGRKLFLRAHNVEHQYFGELAAQSKGMLSWIFDREAVKLKSYEKATAGAFDKVFAISPADRDWFAAQGAEAVWLPPFHGFQRPDILAGSGQYLLYQGDLSLPVNQEAILDMLHLLGPTPPMPVVVAGRSGARSFEEKLRRMPNLRREADVSDEVMHDLVRHAQVVVIHTLHSSGMKLKLFPALFHARQIAATLEARTDTVLDEAIHFYRREDARAALTRLWGNEILPQALEHRALLLSRYPGDAHHAKEIMRYL